MNTCFYGSKKQPQNLFGEDTPELAIFYKTLETELPGGMRAMRQIQQYWNPNAFEHTWTMPDGHVAKVKVLGHLDKKIEIEELGGATFTQRITVNMNDPDGLALAANIVQSIDGYIVREMLRRLHKQNIEMAAIHDSFWAHPNDMNHVRITFNQIMAEIAQSDLLSDILSEITGTTITVRKTIYSLHKQILNANYALS